MIRMPVRPMPCFEFLCGIHCSVPKDRPKLAGRLEDAGYAAVFERDGGFSGECHASASSPGHSILNNPLDVLDPAFGQRGDCFTRRTSVPHLVDVLTYSLRKVLAETDWTAEPKRDRVRDFTLSVRFCNASGEMILVYGPYGGMRIVLGIAQELGRLPAFLAAWVSRRG